MKQIISLLIIILLCTPYAYATQVALKLSPDEIISTAHDEVEAGDKLLFKLEKDVYLDERLLFKKGTRVVAYVEYVTENCFGFGSAEIWCRKIIIKKQDGTYTKPYDTEFVLNGFELLKGLNPKYRRFFEYIGNVFRGKEINIRPNEDKHIIPVWIDY